MKTILKIKESPYGLLLISAFALLVALVVPPVAKIDLRNMSMFSLPALVVVWMIPGVLIIFWLLYLLTKRILYSRIITWVHVLMTVSVTLIMVAVLYIGIAPSVNVANNYELVGNAIQILFILFVFGQLIFLANILLGLLLKKNNHRV